MSPFSPLTYLRLSRIFTVIAAGILFYLVTFSFARQGGPSCGSDGCATVLGSQWGHVFGIPIAFPGLAVYASLLMLGGTWLAGGAPVADRLTKMLMVAIVVAAGWYLWIQAGILGRWCAFCSAAHISGLAAVVSLWLAGRGRPDASKAPGRDLLAGAATAAVVGGLLFAGGYHSAGPDAVAVIQSLPAGPALPLRSSDTTRPTMTIAGVELDPDAFPGWGHGPLTSATLLLSDYTCEFCLALTPRILELVAAKSETVRVIALPAWIRPDGRDVHKILLSVFHEQPAAWQTLSADLASGKISPAPDAVARAAIALLGPEPYGTALRNHATLVDSQLALAAAVQNANRKAIVNGGRLPQLMNGGLVMLGADSDEFRLARFLSGAASSPLQATGVAGESTNFDTGP